MSQIQQLHQDAMAAAERGTFAKRNHDADAAQRDFREALDLETQAAHSVPAGFEPSRSVLFRSAASLALECGQEREAERLAALGLAGDPPDEIADELREILDRTNRANGMVFRLHRLNEVISRWLLDREAEDDQPEASEYAVALRDTQAAICKTLDLETNRSGKQ